MQLLVFPIVNTQITFVTLITSCYTNLSTLKLDTHSSLQTLIHFTRTLLIFGFVISSISIDVIECLDNFVCFSLSSRTSPFQKRALSCFSVGPPANSVCISKILRHDDNILQQYIDTFLATSPNFIETAYSCRFEKFRIKRQQKQQIQMTS